MNIFFICTVYKRHFLAVSRHYPSVLGISLAQTKFTPIRLPVVICPHTFDTFWLQQIANTSMFVNISNNINFNMNSFYLINNIFWPSSNF